MKTPLLLTLTAALLLAPAVQAQTPVAATFTAGHGSWFDDINWSGGVYPGSNTAATVDGAVVRLHARGLATPLVIKSLTLRNEAEADVRDARLQLDDLTVSNATLRVYGSHLLVTRLRVFQPLACSGFSCGGIKLNPSLIEAQEFTLNGTNLTTIFGIGGTNPATADGRGPGHFAQVICQNGHLDGNLEVQFLYGFQPQAGTTYPYITWDVPVSAGSHGQFVNAPEGALVARYNGVGLYITYVGGDGNDVVLTAKTLPVATPPLVHATNSGNWFDPAIWSDGQVPTATKEHVLLARQVGVLATTPGQSVAVKSLTLLNGSELTLSNVTFQADVLAATNSLLHVFSSHLVVGAFRDPGGFGGFNLNPSLLEAQSFELAESNTTASFGLGGTNPAAANALGAGHYARVVTATAHLDGQLAVPFLYGFAPQAGQQFKIIEVTATNLAIPGLTGAFVNAPEGALVTRYNDLGVYLTYVGGDGNDVVLTVQPLPTGATSLVHATQDGDWFDPAIWSDGQVPTATKEHVLFARHLTMQSTAPGQTVNLKALTLLHGAELIVSNLTLHAETIAATNSWLRIFSSHLVVGTFRDPFGGFNLNPSLVEAQRFELVESTTTASFGLGGPNPATATGLGAGHFARVVCDTAQLDGNLTVEFRYGFTPSAGQQFEIIRVNTTNGPNTGLTGRFANGREGGAVAVVGDLMLVLSYVGGDGNDVVLTAVPRPTLALTKELTGTLVLSYPTARGHFYTVESTTNLVPAAWRPFPIVLGNGATHSSTNSTNSTRGFFRLLGDADGDGDVDTGD